MCFNKISIVTPNFNGAKYLEETIRSVIDQNYPNLEYIVIDGGSTDGSVEIIKKYEKHLAYWVSEPDKGLYHAIQKGFDKSTGEIMGWINSDDILHPNSLLNINLLLNKHHEVFWIQGYPNVINLTSEIIYQREPRFKKQAFYLKRYHDLKFIQQESTFWRRELWNETGGFINAEYKYAGDFELWMRFFNFKKLFITKFHLGSFRKREGQISEHMLKEYLNECDMIIKDSYYRMPVFRKIIYKFFYVTERFFKCVPILYNHINFYNEKVSESCYLK